MDEAHVEALAREASANAPGTPCASSTGYTDKQACTIADDKFYLDGTLTDLPGGGWAHGQLKTSNSASKDARLGYFPKDECQVHGWLGKTLTGWPGKGVNRAIRCSTLTPTAPPCRGPPMRTFGRGADGRWR